MNPGATETSNTHFNWFAVCRQTSVVTSGNSLPALDVAGCGQVTITSADTVPVRQTLGVICGEDNQGATFTGNFATTVTTGILTDSSSARRAIAVAALNTCGIP